MTAPKYEPIILSMKWTSDLYRLVTFSVAPGQRRSAIIGPRGATDAQVREAIGLLLANINT